jgi:SpoVK/Ycf46/Vps4 family AAA+-type ATPase
MYLYRKMTNYITFLAYREESGKRINAVFSYDEQKRTYEDVYAEILELMQQVAPIKKIQNEPEEITIYDFLECVMEARRRDYCSSWSKIIDTAKLWLYEYENQSDERKMKFTFSEKIIGTGKNEKYYLLDEDFRKELENIESHAGESSEHGNVVHYILSTHSMETAEDMAETLARSLYRAKRISGRRLEIVKDIAPQFFDSSRNTLEDIVENNYGGIVAFDLTERFGCDPVDYKLVCDFIEKLVKQHRNHCLFFFIYNMDNPGFSYYLLPHLKNYLIPVTLREGSGDRKEAVKYLEKLIKSSEQAEYAGQAAEFLAQYPGEEFSQTDVLQAFEKFGPWSMNKNVFKSYHYDVFGEFTLERDPEEQSPYEKLQSMIGLTKVKKKIDDIIAEDMIEKERKKCIGRGYQTHSMHMIFAGDPGTAKTTVAKHFAGIAKDKGILKSGIFVERGGMDLCGPNCVYAIREAFVAAEGGVLFIDEAYSLKGDTPVSVLIQEMENKRDSVIVILAGYGERMKHFLTQNEGLKSRIPNYVEFPNYSAEELTDIFKLMVKERGFTADPEVVDKAREILTKVMVVDNFGNGRAVRTLLDKSIEKQSVRLYTENKDIEKLSKDQLTHLITEDVDEMVLTVRKDRVPGTARKELEEMIGLTAAKNLLHKAVSFYSLRKTYLDNGINQNKAAMHMVFTGNPGTAKTSVARLFAEILKDEKILPTGQFVEVGRAELVGDHVGETALKVKARFKEAQGGVLFIDEAYSLCDGHEKSFGDEAINTIVQEMENHREDVVVIFAGYTKPMQEFIDRNPGMLSRIAFQINFDDYSTEELCGITNLMLSQNQMKITDAAMDKLRKIYDRARENDDYGNGRFVRKIVDEAIMNLAVRVAALDESEKTLERITTIEESDISDIMVTKQDSGRRIGFFCE